MNRSQDTVIDDDEETCPLCIEEFDLSDKNFRPCPCGYQICQFCFNALKTTYEKSTCPNCRRPYDESTIQYKIPTAEEFKMDLLNKNKKQAAAKRKETEKREVETSARRNLAGVRVKQQNLVYVIGLEPTKKDESVLLETLRGKEFFGQYGDIEKIVVSKAKPGATNQGIGVYVTFRRKEDAASCIDTVDGSVNGDRVLRAQYGTTKYCSAFLRGETCMNKNCSFLHETGEDGHHTSLQNEPSDSRHGARPPLHSVVSSTTRAQLQAQLQAQIQAQTQFQAQTPVHAPSPSQAMARQSSKDTVDSHKGSHDTSALPATAGWAHANASASTSANANANANAPIARARRTSQVASRGTASPQSSHAATPPILKGELVRPVEATSAPPSNHTSSNRGIVKDATRTSSLTTTAESPLPGKSNIMRDSLLEHIKKSLTVDPVSFMYDDSFLSAEERDRIAEMPPLYDLYGGAKRRMMEDREIAERVRLENEVKEKLEAQARSTAEEALEEDNMAAGSLALGGEPEDNGRGTSARAVISRPPQPGGLGDQFAILPSHTPQHFGTVQRATSIPQPPAQNTAFELSDFERRGNQYSQAQYDQISNHQRNGSRYFNNSDVKPSGGGGATLAINSRFQSAQQQQQQPFYSSGVQGPPPGLPTTRTPPVSGGGMFAHGQGFTNTGFGTNKDTNTDMLRGRGGTNASHDISKRGGGEHLADPSILQARIHQGGTAGQSLFGGSQDNSVSPFLNRFSAQGLEHHPRVAPFQGPELHSRVASLQGLHGPRPSTPKVPPGFENALGNITPFSEDATSYPSTPVREPVVVTPAVPIMPAAIAQRGQTPKSKRVESTPAARAQSRNESIHDSVKKEALATVASTFSESDSPASSMPLELANHAVIEPALQVRPDQPTVPLVPHSPAAKLPTVMSNALKENLISTSGHVTKTASRMTAPTETLREIKGGVEPTPSVNTPVPVAEVPRDTLRRPRTLRLTTSMIKQNESAASASPDVEKMATNPALTQTKHEHSRQPSVSSISRSRPSTPSLSERLVSRDVSRAGSPRPGSIVGSAPARGKSKNQTKKERKEKAKKPDAGDTGPVIVSAPATTNEDVAPIVARQKKQKKKNGPVTETGFNAKARNGGEEKPGATKEESDALEMSTPQEGDSSQQLQLPYKHSSEAEVERPTPVPAPVTARLLSPPPATPSLEQPPRSSYTVRDLCNDVAKAGGDSAAIQKLLDEHVPSMARLLGEMVATRNLSRDHPWLTNPSYNSAAYKLSPDSRKGQDYLDGNGYSGNDAFGYVYLPQKEKRALYDGHAVSVADTGDRRHDLLRRCLISPTGWVMRHLSVEESERVLELEERRSLYAEEYGELGDMKDLDVLEEDDFINLGGGIEELGRNGNRHGVCWVTGDDQGEDVDDVYDDPEDDVIGHDDDVSVVSDDDLDLDLASGTGTMPGAWDTAFNRTSVSGELDSATLPPIETRANPSVNLRAMDIEALQSRIKEKQKEVEFCRKEAERAEKALGKKTKELAKWKEASLRV